MTLPPTYHDILGDHRFAGVPIVADPNFTRVATVRRGWLERIFSRPWRPTVKTREQIMPSASIVIQQQPATIFCHPEVAEILRRSFRWTAEGEHESDAGPDPAVLAEARNARAGL